MEDKIGLDAICTAEAKKFQSGSLKDSTTMSLYLRNVMTEAIHQALVLATKQPKTKVYMPHGGYLTGGIDEQSILDVEKLIV